MASKPSIEAGRKQERQRPLVSAAAVEVPVGNLVSCPHCGSEKSRVVTPYWLPDGRVRRNRKCTRCEKKFTTIETPHEAQSRHTKRRAIALAMTQKQCSLCKQVLPIGLFGRKDAIYPRSRCSECLNRRRSENCIRANLRQYGISVEQYKEMLAAQNGGCAICSKRNVKHSHGKNRQPLVFDHCHKTGRFRGLLCQRCNRAIGLFGDSVKAIEAVLIYLRIHHHSEEVQCGK